MDLMGKGQLLLLYQSSLFPVKTNKAVPLFQINESNPDFGPPGLSL